MVTAKRNKAALKFIKRFMRKYGRAFLQCAQELRGCRGSATCVDSDHHASFNGRSVTYGFGELDTGDVRLDLSGFQILDEGLGVVVLVCAERGAFGQNSGGLMAGSYFISCWRVSLRLHLSSATVPPMSSSFQALPSRKKM